MINYYQQLKKDFIIFSVFLVIADIVESRLFKSPLFSKKWLMILVGTYLGILIYDTIYYKYFINNDIHKKIDMDGSISDLLKFIFIFMFQYIVTFFITDSEKDFDNEWFLISGIAFFCYALFIFIESYIPKVQDQMYLNGLLRMSLFILLCTYFLQDDEHPLLKLLPLVLGYSGYYLCSNLNYSGK